jgi:hypothetical protein
MLRSGDTISFLVCRLERSRHRSGRLPLKAHVDPARSRVSFRHSHHRFVVVDRPRQARDGRGWSPQQTRRGLRRRGSLPPNFVAAARSPRDVSGARLCRSRWTDYGTNTADAWRQTGVYYRPHPQGRETCGVAGPSADMKFELIINAQTARMLDLTVPPSVVCHRRRGHRMITLLGGAAAACGRGHKVAGVLA